MADKNLLVAKWIAADVSEAPEAVQERVIQFYKDGSCLVPVGLLGSESEAYPMYYFYQAFENQTIKFESGEQGMFIYRYSIVGDKLTVSTLDGREFSFIREDKKSAFKSRPAEAAKAAKVEIEDREPEEHEWKCPKCGKINQNYVGTCGCGELKPKDAKAFNWAEVHPELVQKKEEAEEPVLIDEPEEEQKPQKPAEPEREPEEHEWKCPNCGKINQNYVGTCGCGEPKPKDAPAFNWAEVHPELVKKKEEVEEPVILDTEEEKKPEKPAEPEREPEEHEWKCPNCGKINQNYVGTCGCGEPKPKDAKAFNWAEVHPELAQKKEPEEAPVKLEPEKKAEPEKPAEPEILPGENEWKCPKCGKINQNYVGTCGCGESKPKANP